MTWIKKSNEEDSCSVNTGWSVWPLKKFVWPSVNLMVQFSTRFHWLKFEPLALSRSIESLYLIGSERNFAPGVTSDKPALVDNMAEQLGVCVLIM